MNDQIVVFKKLSSLLIFAKEEIEAGLDDVGDVTQLKISVEKMTQKEFDDMRQFDGY